MDLNVPHTIQTKGVRPTHHSIYVICNLTLTCEPVKLKLHLKFTLPQNDIYFSLQDKEKHSNKEKTGLFHTTPTIYAFFITNDINWLETAFDIHQEFKASLKFVAFSLVHRYLTKCTQAKMTCKKFTKHKQVSWTF